jgi:hypothetical protein
VKGEAMNGMLSEMPQKEEEEERNIINIVNVK